MMNYDFFLHISLFLTIYIVKKALHMFSIDFKLTSYT